MCMHITSFQAGMICLLILPCWQLSLCAVSWPAIAVIYKGCQYISSKKHAWPTHKQPGVKHIFYGNIVSHTTSSVQLTSYRKHMLL